MSIIDDMVAGFLGCAAWADLTTLKGQPMGTIWAREVAEGIKA